MLTLLTKMKYLLTAYFMTIAFGCQENSRSTAASPASAPATAPSNAFTVMTFNLRYASAKPPNAWWQRRAVMAECIKQVNPDLFGTQEGLYQQLKDIEQDQNGEYAWIGTGRDGGSRGEFMAIFYRKSRYEPLEYDHFWLSDTPNVIASATWGNTSRRMVTWVRFLDRQSKKQFYFWDTHLDNAVQGAREKGAELIRKRIEAIKNPLPLILVGDFNSEAKANKAYDILTEGGFLHDTWAGPEEGTFHDFTGTAGDLGRIDWIFTKGDVTATSTQVIHFNKGGQYPSDHFPVVCQMHW
jgi:endonuclease/exonuclease/phosphatase family metal-dependent hydrolase